MSIKKAAIAMAAISYLALFSAIVFAPPPTPHSIEGTIYNSTTTLQMELGTPFSINDSVSGYYLRSATNVPVPGLSGRYAETISGSDGDLVVLHAWNLTHYGTTNRTLLGDMAGVDIYINYTRPSEANVTILSPPNNSIYNESNFLNITANVTIIGANGIACNATIQFDNETFLNVSLTEGKIHEIGNINRGGYNITSWNITAKAVNTGNRTSANITINAECQDNSVNLEKVAVRSARNITVAGKAPVVLLMSPANNTISALSNTNFTFNASDISDIKNCSLRINNIFNATNSSAIEKNVRQGINVTLNDSIYNWSVECYDTSLNLGVSGHYNITVNTTGPRITSHLLTDPIFLNAGTTQRAWCNATVTPPGADANVSLFNATFFDNIAATFSAPDDNNNHYTNTSCKNVTHVANILNVSCSFQFFYYANNASWSCALRAMDTNGVMSESTKTTIVNELLAINSTAMIEYGDLQVGDISEERNVTIFNLGNVPINITAYGYARRVGDNLSMMCGQNNENGNISVGYQRHYSVFSNPYGQMTPLANASNQSQILNLTIWQRTSDSGHTSDQNNSYWKLLVPEGIGGTCNGTVMLTAIAANLTG